MGITLHWSNEQDEHELPPSVPELLERLLAIAAAKERINGGEVSLVFVDDDEIRRLNARYRGIDRPTDVLSFPMDDEDGPVAGWPGEEQALLGDIVISVPCAVRQSEQYGHSLERELGFLFVHGLLHLFGHDHDTEESERDMFSLQEHVLREAGLER